MILTLSFFIERVFICNFEKEAKVTRNRFTVLVFIYIYPFLAQHERLQTPLSQPSSLT